MNIHKKRVVTAISKEGREYAKVEDIRFPLLSYLLSLPVRVYRVIIFQLKFWGVVPVHIKSDDDKELVEDHANLVDQQLLTFGPIREKSTPFNVSRKGRIMSGVYLVKYAYIDNDLVDGSDVVEFIWKTEKDDEYTTYHKPDLFLRFMFSEELGMSGLFLSDINSIVKEAFNTHLLVHDAKALVDDRTYEYIRISDHKYEIKLKYLGLHISLASDSNEPDSLLALISGVISEEDLLEPFIVKIPLSVIADSSTAVFDTEEETWVHI
ncbi:MAG: hypothetical protein ABW170_22615 [Candidatus Thiodiazotropha sp. L084R]